MQLPEELQCAIDQMAQHSRVLNQARVALTQDYREGKSSPFSDETKRLAYLGCRMPATYAAVHKVLENAPAFTSLADLGAGPGTASWAATQVFPSIEKVTLVEKSPDAVALGRKLAASSSHLALREARWIAQPLSEALPPADAAILSYVLNEVTDPHLLIERCWQTYPLLILIEPGTPKGFRLIRALREQLLRQQAYLIAPCPHHKACPIEGHDWCHFAARVERSRLHRLLKGGTLGYEDEKFSYLIAAKTPVACAHARIIRPPEIQKGSVRLSLCAADGKLEERVVFKKEKPLYRKARDVRWGQTWDGVDAGF